MDTPLFTRRMLIATSVAASGVFGLLLLWHGFHLFLVVAAGVMLGIFFDGLTSLLQRHTRLSHGWAFAVVVVLLTTLLGGIFLLIGSQIASQVDELAERIPRAVDTLRTWLGEQRWGTLLLSNMPSTDEMAQGGIGRHLGGAFSTTMNVFTYTVIALLIGFYAALHRALYVRGLLHLVPKKHRQRAHEVVGAVGHALRWWYVGRFASMAVVGVLTTLGLMVLGVPLALTLGLLAALLSFVPYIGPLVSSIPAILMGLLESPTTALMVAGLFGIIQFLESYFITPLIERRTVSLPPVLLITAELVFGYAMGVLGMLLAVPLAVVFIVLIQLLYVNDALGDTSVEILGE